MKIGITIDTSLLKNINQKFFLEVYNRQLENKITEYERDIASYAKTVCKIKLYDVNCLQTDGITGILGSLRTVLEALEKSIFSEILNKNGFETSKFTFQIEQEEFWNNLILVAERRPTQEEAKRLGKFITEHPKNNLIEVPKLYNSFDIENEFIL